MSPVLTPESFAEWMKEDLDPRFDAFIEDIPPFGKSIRHPLVYDIGGINPGLANRSLEEKETMLITALANNEWWQAVWCYERPWRLWGFMQDVMPEFNADNVWGLPREVQDIVLDIWMDSENIEQHADEWLELFAGRPDGAVLGNDEELEWFASLPSSIPVFRGNPESGDNFLSWTTSEETALWFANRWQSSKGVAGKIDKQVFPKEVFFAAITRRGESELLAFPETGA